eukprot:TRINITY_DN23591_c0_g1_i1.p1 TRINITY_DN23591_c0_g1~~TRINITY_DN23591_c0_g1_i1.p1  ORF type:complete len:170 (-),score=57.58 TRINITY_DN23591_c0_g1_i1:15-488(-)
MEEVVRERKKVEISELVLNKAIEELGVLDLMNAQLVESLKSKIEIVNQEIGAVVKKKGHILSWGDIPASHSSRHKDPEDDGKTLFACNTENTPPEATALAVAKLLGYTKVKSFQSYSQDSNTELYYIPSLQSTLKDIIYSGWGVSTQYPVICDIEAE